MRVCMPSTFYLINYKNVYVYANNIHTQLRERRMRVASAEAISMQDIVT